MKINPNNINLSYMYQDEQLFNCFKLVRTSDKQIYALKNSRDGNFAYTFDFSIFTLYNPKLGRIQVQ